MLRSRLSVVVRICPGGAFFVPLHQLTLYSSYVILIDMSEYPGYSSKKPLSIDDLPPEDLKDTLFDPRLDEVEKAVDTHNVSYDVARRRLGVTESNEPLTDKEKYPYWPIDEYYKRRLAMLAVISEITKLEGFNTASGYKSEIADRYGSDVGRIKRNASSKQFRLVENFRNAYGVPELLHSGEFDYLDVIDDANMALLSMKHTFAGPDNRSKRDKERRKLEKRLKNLHHTDEVA